jgi:cytoskeletal protein CcmA (bactofilin family)
MKDFPTLVVSFYFGPMNTRTTRRNDKAQPDNHVAIIGEGVELRGNLETSEDLRICGSLAGSINSQSKVILSPTSSVRGDINCREAEIFGRVKGNLHVRGLLRLKGNAVVEGDISAERLQVEEGVFLMGKCQMYGVPG